MVHLECYPLFIHLSFPLSHSMRDFILLFFCFSICSVWESFLKQNWLNDEYAQANEKITNFSRMFYFYFSFFFSSCFLLCCVYVHFWGVRSLFDRSVSAKSSLFCIRFLSQFYLCSFSLFNQMNLCLVFFYWDNFAAKIYKWTGFSLL